MTTISKWTGIVLLLPLLVYGESRILHTAINNDYSTLEALYQYFHQHPELSFHEEQTANRIADEMRSIGFRVTENVGGYGVVSVLKNGEGPTLLLRTDMDALPVKEVTGLSYASRVEAIDSLGKKVSVMHACGHDIHMTVFIGTARRLASMKANWRGTLVMISQPAEERGAGARAMIKDGLFSRFPRPDYNLGLHVSADHSAGTVAYVPGYAMANVDMVDVTLHGIGGHGAYPHTTKDPVVLAAQFINALQTLVSREISPIEAGVVTVGSIHGGTKHNIISERVDLQLTIRSYTDQSRGLLLDGIKRIAKGQAESMGLPPDKLPTVRVRNEYTPAVYNQPKLTEKIRGILEQRLGVQRVVRGDPVMGGEDFAEYGRVEPKIPSSFLWLGGVEPESYRNAKINGLKTPSLHSGLFAPEPKLTIVTGVESMTGIALDLLSP